MKITHIIIGLGVGGAELMLKRLVEGLNGKNGMQHSIISLTELGPVGKQLQEAGINVKALGMKSALNLPVTFFKLRRELKKQKPDIVQTWMYHADFLGGLAAKSLGIHNIIWNVRNTHLYSKGVFKIFFREVLSIGSRKIPKKIIYVSHSAQKEHAKYGFQTKNSKVIGNGFDTNKFIYSEYNRQKYRKEIGLLEGDIAVFSVGRYNHAKDHETFIKSICLAYKKNNSIKGVLVGREIKLDYFDLTAEERKKFIVLGQKNNIAEILSAADIFCLHSITEGFPNVLGEAMSIGLPCITTKAGDAELILNDIAYTSEVRDFFSISEKIVNIANLSIFHRRKLGEVNRLRIINNYSIEIILNQYFILYRDL